MPLLILLLIVVPLAELFLIVQIGQAIGVWPTIGILLADSVLGAALLRSQGRAAWRRFNEALDQGKVPAREVVDGVLVILGGAFLLTPGFITDVIGLILILPPTRRGIRAVLAARLMPRMVRDRTAFIWRTAPRAGPGSGSGRPGPRGSDIEGTAREVNGNGSGRETERRELPPS